jgi:dipeptidyl aminopeptidase/acylaminoacyl peptidase
VQAHLAKWSSFHDKFSEKERIAMSELTSPLIPRQVLFGNPDKTNVRLSPDGSKVAYLAPMDGVLNVWVGPVNDPATVQPVTHDTNRGIRFYFWAYTSNHILYLQDKAGDENWRVYSVHLDDETIDLTPIEGVHAQVQQVSPDIPDEIVIGLNDRDPRLHDIYRVHINTGECTLIRQNEGFMSLMTDDQYDVRFALRMLPDGSMEVLKPAGDTGWEQFTTIPMEDTLTTAPIAFDKSRRRLYVIDSRGRNTAALFVWDLDSGERKLLADDPRADVGDLIIHPTERTVQAVSFNYERERWQVIDPAIADDLTFLGTVSRGDFHILSRTLDDRYWIVAYTVDDGPVRYYRYDNQINTAQFLFTDREELAELPLARMYPVVIKSRDGMDLVSYYTLPFDSDRNGNGQADRPLPMILFVHGGPWGRDTWGYNAWHQWLANRGYAVLSVNFRASTGLGKAFINAGNREWAARMHDDLIDAVDWAVSQGIADRHRIAIMGGSYGGYATLVGLTFTPTTFVCGVDIVGPANLVTLLQSIPPYWEPEVELFATRVGDHRTEEGRALLTERSPLTRVDRIQRPLLIGQGANDPRVKQAESDQIVNAMQQKGIPVTYVLYPDEGHGFARPENRLSFNAVAEAFLAEHLGGRCEPIGNDFAGSSIRALVGAEYVQGLAEALPTPAT